MPACFFLRRIKSRYGLHFFLWKSCENFSILPPRNNIIFFSAIQHFLLSIFIFNIFISGVLLNSSISFPVIQHFIIFFFQGPIKSDAGV